MRHLFFILIIALWPALVTAQTYPDYTSITVNDFANILSEDERADISAELDKLREETGVEMVLVTMARLSDYATNTSMERYATGLFNTWGIGDKTRNDGILVLILIEDREMRVELGAGYPKAWDDVAQDVIDYGFLPDFRNENYPAGIKTGISTTVAKIARPFAAKEAPERSGFSGSNESQGSKGSKDMSWLWVLLVPLLAFPFWRKIKDMFARFSTCPSCGRKGGLRARSNTIRSATTSSTGLGERHVHCSYCDYSKRSDYTIARRSKNKSSSFSGGRSSGGGASGRW